MSQLECFLITWNIIFKTLTSAISNLNLTSTKSQSSSAPQPWTACLPLTSQLRTPLPRVSSHSSGWTNACIHRALSLRPGSSSSRGTCLHQACHFWMQRPPSTSSASSVTFHNSCGNAAPWSRAGLLSTGICLVSRTSRKLEFMRLDPTTPAATLDAELWCSTVTVS